MRRCAYAASNEVCSTERPSRVHNRGIAQQFTAFLCGELEWPADRSKDVPDDALPFPCVGLLRDALVRDSSPLAAPAWLSEADDSRFRVEARYYEKLAGKTVRFKRCPVNVRSPPAIAATVE